MADKTTAKMAEIARGLPKWQPTANVVPNDLPIWQKVWHDICSHKKIFFLTQS
jgi:hypothetical protein